MRTLRSLTLALLFLAALPLAGQIGVGTMTGRITDSTGALVPGVSVTIVQVATNFTFSSVTNAEGIFRVPALQPGVYRVTFQAEGFKRLVRDNLELKSGDTLPVDAVLEVGTVSESIEVTGAPPLLQTETSATGSLVEGDVLYNLPLYQRYINSTLNLVPGMSSGGYAYGGDLGAYHLAGQRNGAIGIFEDGVNGNDQMSGTGTVKPVQNAVAEVKVLTTTLPAEYGHSAGGVISVVKKSGTNEIHGMASLYGRNRPMQHRLYFDKFRTSQPTPTRPEGLPSFFLLPDANIGGPIVIPGVYDGRNKTFFFIGYQRLIEKKVAQVLSTVPTDAMKAGDFAFPTSTVNAIFDPSTTRQEGGAWKRDPFPQNRIPLSLIDPVARKVLQIDPWVAPNQPGTFNANGPVDNLLADEFALVVFDDYSGRFDHQFNPNFKIYGSFTENRQSGFGRPWNLRNPVFDAVAGPYQPFEQRNISMGKTWIVSPTLINDARIGYFRRRNDRSVPSEGGNWGQQLGIPNVNPDLLPRMGGNSTDRNSVESLYGLHVTGPSRLINETLSFRNDLTKISGTHAFKMGYEFLRYRLNSTVTNIPSGWFRFDGVTAGLQSNGALAPNTGNTFAGFLTGAVRQAQFDAELTSWLPRSSIHSFYFQDDWKFSSTLTLNLGVRYSNESPFTTKYSLMSNFDPGVTDPVTGRMGAIVHPTGALNRRDNNNFQPRIGLAWNPTKKWVFRAGFALNTVDVKFPMLRAQFEEYVAQANQEPLPGDPRPLYQISRGPNPVNFTISDGKTSPFIGTNFGARNVEWWDPALRNPYVLNWNSTLQYQLADDYSVEVMYMASSGIGLVERWQANTFPIDAGANDPALRSEIFRVPQNYRPWSQFGDIRMRSNFGHSTFHSGTIKLEKRMSKGTFFSTFYTLSKAINSQDNDNDGTGIAPIQNRGLEKARAGYDRNHRWIATVNYELPFGKGKKWMNSNRFMNWIFGGLEIAWIQTVESGNPLTFTYAGSPYNYFPTFAGNRRPDIVSSPQLVDNWRDTGGDRFNLQNINPIVDINNFAYPGGCPAVIPSGFDRSQCDFRLGNSGRNIMTGTPLLWAQVMAQKNFTIKERYNVQLRWDMQNALKTYNFNPPTTSVDFRNPRTFGKLTSDPRTASLGGQPLMNLTLQVSF